VARVLIVEGGGRGLRLARGLIEAGNAVRVVSSEATAREPVEALGAEFQIGTPHRLATLRGALEHVTIVCWLLADAKGPLECVRALHGARLAQFLRWAVDTTVRGFLYEAGGTVVPAEVLAGGERIVWETAARNSISAAILAADPSDLRAWLAQALATVASLLAAPPRGPTAVGTPPAPSIR
jgi:hypothetical protein